MLFAGKAVRELLQQTQENLIVAQNNNQMLCETIVKLSETPKEQPVVEQESLDQWTAAYALNLCTVSVSQIVDYDDIRFLEYEYEAILNNLNLENMPDDDALRDVLKQLLNVITFFRIQEGDKQMLEREYQHKMKNQIWSAVPNLGVIIATGNPVAMAVSLATQVGIGYMNYRKAKAENELEKAKQEWQLQRSAMEQINGLRRELFETAWKLTKRYKIKDEFRLTERQISQYNNILLDQDLFRRYERLWEIEKCFVAYPPFWYYLGHTAAEIYHNEMTNREPNLEIAGRYKAFAISHFVDFRAKTENNLLREDHLAASCALEYADLIEDSATIMDLLADAKKYSGNAPDVLQLCALGYLKIGAAKEAEKLMRVLVNEGYNVDINANMLSRFYFTRLLSGDVDAQYLYDTLNKRENCRNYMIYLPKELPQTKAGQDKLVEDYVTRQRNELIERSTKVLETYITRKKRAFHDMCGQYGNISAMFSRFMHILCDEVKCLKLNRETTFSKLLISPGLSDKETIRVFVEDERARSQKNIERVFDDSFQTAFDMIKAVQIQTISDAQTMEKISDIVMSLNEFCAQNKLPHYETVTGKQDVPTDEFLQAIYDDEYEKKMAQEERKIACLQVVEEYADKIVLPGVSAKDMWFASSKKGAALSYAQRHKKDVEGLLSNISDSQMDIDWIAVLNDRSVGDTDLLVTTKGISVLSWRKSASSTLKSTATFAEIQPGEKEGTLMIGNYEYSSKHVDIEALYEMIVKLAGAVR